MAFGFVVSDHFERLGGPGSGSSRRHFAKHDRPARRSSTEKEDFREPPQTRGPHDRRTEGEGGGGGRGGGGGGGGGKLTGSKEGKKRIGDQNLGMTVESHAPPAAEEGRRGRNRFARAGRERNRRT